MLLQLENVQKQYKDFRLNCSLQVEEGCITGIIGANGAGKSTTFKAVLGLLRTDGGSIRIFGKDSRDIPIADKQQIGVVLAENTFNDTLLSWKPCTRLFKKIISLASVNSMTCLSRSSSKIFPPA